jgi:hypothetical protein
MVLCVLGFCSENHSRLRYEKFIFAKTNMNIDDNRSLWHPSGEREKWNHFCYRMKAYGGYPILFSFWIFQNSINLFFNYDFIKIR